MKQQPYILASDSEEKGEEEETTATELEITEEEEVDGVKTETEERKLASRTIEQMELEEGEEVGVRRKRRIVRLINLSVLFLTVTTAESSRGIVVPSMSSYVETVSSNLSFLYFLVLHLLFFSLPPEWNKSFCRPTLTFFFSSFTSLPISLSFLLLLPPLSTAWWFNNHTFSCSSDFQFRETSLFSFSRMAFRTCVLQYYSSHFLYCTLYIGKPSLWFFFESWTCLSYLFSFSFGFCDWNFRNCQSFCLTCHNN
jgi:hypothetical protein